MKSNDASASPSSQNNTFNGAAPVHDNMAIGSGSNGGFDSRSNQSFHDNLNIPAAVEIPPTDTSLIGLDGNMMTGSSPRNFDNSFFGIGNNEMNAQNQDGNLNSSYIKLDQHADNINRSLMSLEAPPQPEQNSFGNKSIIEQNDRSIIDHNDRSIIEQNDLSGFHAPADTSQIHAPDSIMIENVDNNVGAAPGASELTLDQFGAFDANDIQTPGMSESTVAGFDGINIEPIQRRGSIMMSGITGIDRADQNDRRSSLLATTNLLASFVQQNEAAQA